MGIYSSKQLDIFGIPLSDTDLTPLIIITKRKLYHKCWNCGKRIERTVKFCLKCQIHLYLEQKSLDEFKGVEIIERS